MSAYTTEVRYVCEVYAGREESGDFTDIDGIVENARTKIFGSYPIFDETYRPILEKKILKHYYTREICEETVGLWKLRLQNRMNEIMPYFNKLYQSELIEFNPLYDIDITKTGNNKGTNSGEKNRTTERELERNSKENNSNMETFANTTKTDQTTTNNLTLTDSGTQTKTGSGSVEDTGTLTKTTNEDRVHWDLYSDTPQGDLNGINAIDNKMYLTNARKITADDVITETGGNTLRRTSSDNGTTQTSNTNTNTGTVDNDIDQIIDGSRNNLGNTEVNGSEGENITGNETHEINTTEQYMEHVYGKNGGVTFSEALIKYRDTFLNIDLQVINALDDLFFRLW